MRHFSTLLVVLALGFVAEMGTSCTKETASAAPTANVANATSKLNQQDTTSTSQPHGSAGCGSDGGTNHGAQY